MKRRYRLLLSSALIIGCLAAFALLTSLSAGAEGPIAAGLSRLGTAIGRLEHGIRGRFTGGGREQKLAWFARYRDNPASLREPDSVLLGAFDSDLPQSLDGIARLDEVLGRTLPLVQFYAAWGDKPEHQFPLAVTTAIWDFGSVPVITWEPWLTEFDSRRHPELPLRSVRENHGLVGVARGDYDFYIDAWARDAAQFGKPFYLRFAHEMNDAYRYPWGPQNNSKEEFIAAWRHVVERFRSAGATNVIWVWSPHVAYEYWEMYYPGADYVDWVGTGALNYGPIARWSQWWSFAEIFGSKYNGLAAFGKPVMVAEFGSLAFGGDQAAWFREALVNLPRRYPSVRAVLFFHVKDDNTVTPQKVDWTIASESRTSRTIAASIETWAPGPRTMPMDAP